MLPRQAVQVLCVRRPTRDIHTLLLVQYNQNMGSRTFADFESTSAAMDGVCTLYEKELQTLNPNKPNITYDIADLFAFLDQLASIHLLV